MSEAYEAYDEVSERLNKIVDEVNDPEISLDSALALYEEAVKLGLLACDLSEEGALELLEEQTQIEDEQDGAGDSTTDDTGSDASDNASELAYESGARDAQSAAPKEEPANISQGEQEA